MVRQDSQSSITEWKTLTVIQEVEMPLFLHGKNVSLSNFIFYPSEIFSIQRRCGILIIAHLSSLSLFTLRLSLFNPIAKPCTHTNYSPFLIDLTFIIDSYDNATGVVGNFESNIDTDTLLDTAESGAATTADPGVISYAFEFPESDATTMMLPDLTENKEVTCYMTSQPIAAGIISGGDDLTTIAELTAVTVPIISTSDDDNNDTSGAMELVANKAVLSLLAIFGFMNIF